MSFVVQKQRISRKNQPAVTGPNAHVFMQTPNLALHPFVERFVIVEFPFDRELKLLPTTNFFAELRIGGENGLDGQARLPDAVISGLRDKVRSRSYKGGSAIMLIKFTEMGAIAFLRNPLDRFFNRTTSMGKVFEHSTEFGPLDQQLAAAKNHTQRIQIMESFLLEHIRKTRLDPVVSDAIACLEQNGSTIHIEELAREMGLSQSALERRFRRKVGASPKRFASILRIKCAIHLRIQGQDFTSIAHSAGYSDQSHFINDFKRATGFAPSSFFRRSRMCKNAEFLQVAFASNPAAEARGRCGN